MTTQKKKNHVWIIEGFDPKTKKWVPVYGMFYYIKKEAASAKPSSGDVRCDGIGKFRVTKYEAN